MPFFHFHHGYQGLISNKLMFLCNRTDVQEEQRPVLKKYNDNVIPPRNLDKNSNARCWKRLGFCAVLFSFRKAMPCAGKLDCYRALLFERKL